MAVAPTRDDGSKRLSLTTNLAVVFHAATMVDALSSVLLPAKILLPALKLHACMVNGATTVLAVLLALPLVNQFPLNADSVI
jgi:hypothetical protein